jgi:hypothetical protein
MKLVFFAMLLFINSAAHAAATTDRQRIKEMPGVVYGVLHTENYEYVCETIDGSDKAVIKTWLDVDYSAKNPYRFAVGFANGAKFLGFKAVESKVIRATRARCPGLCLNITLAGVDGQKPASVEFVEDQISHKITMRSIESGENGSVGTCTKNEVH